MFEKMLIVNNLSWILKKKLGSLSKAKLYLRKILQNRIKNLQKLNKIIKGLFIRFCLILLDFYVILEDFLQK